MNELINIKCKSKSGQIVDFNVSEILEIDGQHYQPAEDTQQLKSLVNHLTGRIATIEAIIGGHQQGE